MRAAFLVVMICSAAMGCHKGPAGEQQHLANQAKRYDELCSSIEDRIATIKELVARNALDPRAQTDHDQALREAQDDRDHERSLLESLQTFCDAD